MPERLTVSIENPPERSKSTARAPPFTTVTSAMSWEAGSAESVPKSGRFTLTPSNW